MNKKPLHHLTEFKNKKKQKWNLLKTFQFRRFIDGYLCLMDCQ